MCKKIKFWLVLMSIIAIIPNINAQYLLNNTYFNPIPIPQVTTKYLNETYVGNGLIFTGQAYYTDNLLTKYSGYLTDSDGNRFYSNAFHTNFSVSNGETLLYVPASKKVAYLRVAQNGSWKIVSTYDIEGKSFWVEGTQIHFVDDYSSPSVGIYSSGSTNGYSSDSSNGSSSNYHNPASKRTCPICNSSGLCRQCNGTGNRVVRTSKANHIDPCGVCYSTGKCQQCHGSGKVF